MSELMQELVCICIPTYNSALTIRESLLSITEQNYSNLKIKVVDNNSTDDTITIVSSIADDRIELYRNSFNVGAEGNFNRCIELSEGKYTAIFHADDVYESQMVARQVAFLEENPSAGGVFTEATLINERGQQFGVIRQPLDVAAKGPLFDFNILYKAILRHSNFLICPSFLARTDVYRQDIRVWRGEMFGSSADLDVWLRVLKHHSCGILAEPLMRYRISTAQFSAGVRRGVERADFFRVIDYYHTQDWVTAQLDKSDYLNYLRLGRRDRYMRAANSLLSDDKTSASQLCNDVLTIDTLLSATQSRRGLMVFVLGAFVRITLNLGMTGLAKPVLNFFKKNNNK